MLSSFIIYDFPNSPTVELFDIKFQCPGQFCLNTNRFDEIIEFCKEINCKIIFGLNELVGKIDNYPNIDQWNCQNAFNLLAYIKSKKYVEDGYIYGFELGNELDKIMSVYDINNDYVLLYNEINKLWPDRDIRPKLIGPGINYIDVFYQYIFIG